MIRRRSQLAWNCLSSWPTRGPVFQSIELLNGPSFAIAHGSKSLATIRFGYTVPVRFPRVGSSMVEQRPFKALVVGSSPTQPIFEIPAVNPRKATSSGVPRRFEATHKRYLDAPVRCSLLHFFWALLAGFTLLTPSQRTHLCLLLGRRR